jgi:hypothetical protein
VPAPRFTITIKSEDEVTLITPNHDDLQRFREILTGRFTVVAQPHGGLLVTGYWKHIYQALIDSDLD